MKILRPFAIAGVGWHLPQVSVASSEIEQELNLPSGWVAERTGVSTRYRAVHESNTDMAHAALKNALENAQLDFEELDYVIAAAATFDYVIPNRSTLIKASFDTANKLDTPCMDINTVCTSFMTAIDTASRMLQNGECRYIAIVSSEKGSLGLNSNDPETYSLFGDAAAAIILSATSDTTGGLIRYQLKTYSEGVMDTMIPGGGNMHHPRHHTYSETDFSFQMKGIRLLRSAQQHLPKFLADFFEGMAIGMNEVDWIVPHQASKMGLKMLEHLNGHMDNVIDQLAHYGNCIAASIPLALATSIKEGKIKEGQNCLLLGTAAGMSIGAVLLTYRRS